MRRRYRDALFLLLLLCVLATAVACPGGGGGGGEGESGDGGMMPPASCGDGTVQAADGETCDPPGSQAGPNDNDCRDDCTVCGDGVKDQVEGCDDGNANNNDGCRNDYTLPGCGDDVVDVGAGETCDPPGSPAGGNGNDCRNDCTVCGDGVVDPGEGCDDGNGNDNDDCSNDCIAPGCGDGTVDVKDGETCDPPGSPAGGNGNDCRNDCTVCGDGVVDPGEDCDDQDGIDIDECRNDCSEPFCGDGRIDAQLSETCDPPGFIGGLNGQICRVDCTVCGDGIVDPGEDCDDGNGNTFDECRNDCTLRPLQATFTGMGTTPDSMSMQPGPALDQDFQVAIAVTDVTDFFSSQFRVTFDEGFASFVGFDASTSFLSEAGVMTSFDVSQAGMGELTVTAERIYEPPTLSFAGGATLPGSISLTGGTITDPTFEVLVDVTEVLDFFGAAFRVSFDPSTASFVGFDASGSFLEDAGVTTDYTVSDLGGGQIAIAATRLQNAQGDVPGVDVTGTQTLIALTFQATGPTDANVFTLDAPREVCPPEPGCLNPISVSWFGGTMSNTEGTPGVDVTGTRDLILLDFEATAETTGTPYDFVPVEVCDSSQQPACNPIALSYLGGTLVVD
jgi:cysteine-rich repeat protein